MHGLSKERDIDPWLKRFVELDADGSGRLDKEVRKVAWEGEGREEREGVCCIFLYV